MEPRTNFHPVYLSGQYLTSEHLNETHNFLWQEEKATRYLLAGNGIAQGLQADLAGVSLLQKVNLSKGSASTIDGYLLQASKNTVFDKGIPQSLVWYSTEAGQQLIEKTEFEKIKATLNLLSTKELNAFEIFADSTLPANLPEGFKTIEGLGISSSDVASNYLLLAWVYIKDLENSQCQQGDCNTKGMQRNYNIRYFLIANSQFPQLNFVNAELNTCAVARIKTLSAAGSKAGLFQKSHIAWSKSYANLLPYFTNDLTKGLNLIAGLINADEQAALNKSKLKFTQINQSVNIQNCPQYYALFASDLAKSINELVGFYNDYIKKYPAISGDRIERTIIIGGFTKTGIDKWRYYFITAPDLVQSRFDNSRLKKLFRRVLAMVDNFILQNIIVAISKTVINKPLAIPTLTGDALLQNCAIPYYYDIKTLVENENAILKYWNPQGGSLKNIYCYYDSLVLERADMAGGLTTADWYNANAFRIEGHVGLPKQQAITAITNLINSEGLPIQLIDCDVNYKGPNKWTNWYTNFVANLDTWVTLLRKDYKEYDFSPIKNVQQMVTQTSYRNVEQVTKIINDFNAYSGVFYNKPAQAAPPSGKAKAAPDPKTGIPPTAYKKFTDTVKKETVLQLNKDFKEALTEQNDLQAKKLITLADLYDLEYNSGAPKGGTFVLLHDGTTVIGDGSLPYYYRINQVRIYSV